MTFKKKNLKITLGKESDTTDDAKKLGHTLYFIGTDEAYTDKENNIVTTSAYMDDKAPIHKVFEGIEALVVEIKKLLA
jgi:enhancing lycopene biosynthesis protein 2